MKAAAGYVKDIQYRHGVRVVTVETFPPTTAAEDPAFCTGMPVSLLDGPVVMDNTAPAPLTAAGLSPAHLGARIRVTVLGGATIEDQLVGVDARWNEGKHLVYLAFRTIHPAPSVPFSGFPVVSGAEVTIVKEPAK